MPPARRVLLVRCVLGALLTLALLAFWRVDFHRKVSTDVLDLIPGAERSPELALVRSLASEQQARVILLALDLPAGSPHRDAAAAAFLASLQTAPGIAEAVPMTDRTARETLGRALFERRLDLLLPGWLAARRRDYAAARTDQPWSAWLAEDTARRLEAYLARPEALAFQDLVASDPLLLVPEVATAFQGLEESAPPVGGPVLVWARSRASPLSEEGQAPVIQAVESALAAARAIEPGAALRWSAIARFAATSRARIEREISLLNIISFLAVLAVGALCLRQVLKAVHLAAVIIGGLAGAWLVTLHSFDRIHVLVFVVGSLLGGVAVDYGFYLYLQPPAFDGEPYGAKVARLLKPLLASALTTVLGFSLLLFSELPLIRQLGVFVSAGLLGALGVALLWFAQVRPPFMRTRAFIAWRPRGTTATRMLARLVLAGALVVAVSGPWRLHWHDDIRELEIGSPALRDEAAAVQALFGDHPDRTTYLTYGADPAAARDALARFQTWHDTRHPAAPLVSLGLVLPTRADYAQAVADARGLADFAPALQAALARHGFEAEAFAPFFGAWRTWRDGPHPDYANAIRAFTGELQGPLGLLASTGAGASWFVSLAPHPVSGDEDPPAVTGTMSVNQLQSLNRLFSRYRVSALRLSAMGLGLVGLSVFALYGWRLGARIFAVPAGACLFAFGVLGFAGQPLNLFHLLGAFLGVCLSHNYAIFSAENARRREVAPPSIRLSALTTASSFAVLALSHIPVVAALGTTVTLIVLAALVIVELEPLAFGGEGPSANTSPPAES